MKLCITLGSPYAWLARIVVPEKRLENRSRSRLPKHGPWTARTTGSLRRAGFPYLVPRQWGGLEESVAVCRYLDHLKVA
jgi:Glutathione S-transferase, N-terminal domain